MKSLQNLTITNHFHTLGKHFYKEVHPQGLKNPEIIKTNSEAAVLLNLDPGEFNSDLFLQVFSGNSILSESLPLAHDYAGHQFGNFNPFLGDGRALLLFDVETDNGLCEVNLKGSGKTPYARELDGRASLSSCLHEYEMSVKLASLGIPTTQSLCIIAGDEQIYRKRYERAAILTRIAPGFIRFGTFENYYFQRNVEALRQLTHFVIRHYYPECFSQEEYDYALFLRQVVIRTAHLIAHWQAVGFVHGMLNTDNQSILGVTLDLGESSFTESFDAEFVSSANDEKGRYAFGQQPVIGLWNCNVLARALSPLISDDKLRSALESYETEYLKHYDMQVDNNGTESN
jgi:uncharacterized protein YdiU (UPF0061 family)